MFDLSAEYIVIIKSKMTFFDSNVVVDSMSVIIPYSCSCKFYFARKDEEKNYFFVLC